MELSSLDLKNAKISIALDRMHWIGVTSNAIGIYSADNALVKSISLPFLDANQCDLTWTPNSIGLFLLCGSNIYYVMISTGEVQLIEANRLDSYFGPKFIWIPSK